MGRGTGEVIEDNATACDSSPLNQYQRRLARMSRRSMLTSVREVGNDSDLNVFFYDIYPYICATVFFLAAGCATTTGSIPGAPPRVRCR